MLTPYGTRLFLEAMNKLHPFMFTIVLDDPELDRANLYAHLETADNFAEILAEGTNH